MTNKINIKWMSFEEITNFFKENFKERPNVLFLSFYSNLTYHLKNKFWMTVKEFFDSIYWKCREWFVLREIWDINKLWEEEFFKRMYKFFDWKRPKKRNEEWDLCKKKWAIDNYLCQHWYKVKEVYDKVFWERYKTKLSKELWQLNYEDLKKRIFKLFKWVRPNKNTDKILRNQVEDYLMNKWIKIKTFYDETFWRVISDSEKFFWKEFLEAKDKDKIFELTYKMFNWVRPSVGNHWRRKYHLFINIMKRKWFYKFADTMDEIFWRESRSVKSNNKFNKKVNWMWELNNLKWKEFEYWLFKFCNWVRPEYKDKNWDTWRYYKISEILYRKWYQNIEEALDSIFWKMKNETQYKEFRFLEWEEFKEKLYEFFNWERPTEIWENSSWRSYIVLYRIIRSKWYERPSFLLNELFWKRKK